MWIILAFISSLLLGLYDVTKKLSLRDNAVIPVLFFACTTGAAIFAPIILLSVGEGALLKNTILYVPAYPLDIHPWFFLKSVIVGSSWILAYFALRNLPLTIVTPIRSTGPLWTLTGSLIIFGERLTALQWIGFLVALAFFYVFSLAGKHEGFSLRRNKWLLFMVLSTIMGSISSLYDKYLIDRYDRMAVQAWFSVYMVAVMLPILLLLWYPKRKEYHPFQWRNSILFIGLLLSVADFAYFYAISIDGSLIAIISIFRRSSVLVSFTLGAWVFHESNIRRKGLALLGIVAGLIIIAMGSLK